MIKTIIWVAFLIVILLYAADTKIEFKPFSISFGRGWSAIGYVLIGVGVACLYYQGYADGVKNGVNTTFKYFNQVIKSTPKVKQ